MLKGFFGAISDEPVTYVNAPQLARAHGVEVRDVNCATPTDYVNLLTLRGGGHTIAGTLAGRRGDQRIVNIDDTPFECKPREQGSLYGSKDPLLCESPRVVRAGGGA